MSVGEHYVVAVDGPDEGLVVAARLAEKMGLVLDWAGAWTTGSASGPEPFESRLLALFAQFDSPAQVAFLHDAWSASMVTPTLKDVRSLIGCETSCAWCAHWTPADGAPESRATSGWLSYVDRYGTSHEDARVYGIELAHNCVPLTAPDPSCEEFHYGPVRSTGWALYVLTGRDHMTVDQLRASLAELAAIPVASIVKRYFS